MEADHDVVIIGAGIAGLATALGLYRKGVRSLVLESSEGLRTTGAALTQWTNAFRALDSLGVGDKVRETHVRLNRVVATSVPSRVITANMTFNRQANMGNHEVRCVRRNVLLEILESELPQGTVRYSSKIVSIEELDQFKLLHLADGSTLKIKVLIGCDGVNSVVAKWLGFSKPSFTGRLAARGFAEFPEGHGYDLEFSQYFGEGMRAGYLPCDDKSIYWFFTWIPSQGEEVQDTATTTREYILSKMKNANVPKEIVRVIERSNMNSIVSSPLRFRSPFELIRGNITDQNVCVAGDALHPMTPDIGQGGCSALEDSVVLARCLGEALNDRNNSEVAEHERIKKGLEKYADERRWRSFELVATAYVVGKVQQSEGAFMGFLRDKCLSKIFAGMLLKKAEFDCGKL